MTGWPKPKLVVLSGDQHDLPPKWDGVDVRWSEWRTLPWTTVSFHGPPDVCDCGSGEDRRVSCDGRIPGAGRGVIRFLAIRCMDCHADTVWDEDTGEVWSLDVTDYSDNGSIDPRTVTA